MPNSLTLSNDQEVNQSGLARQAFLKKSGKSIIALTVKDILGEQIAYKLA
jgi:hypothetical protein